MFVATAILLLGAAIGSGAFSAFVSSGALHDGPAIGRELFGAAAMESCGRGTSVPLAAADPNADGPFAEFLNGRRPAIACDGIAGGTATEPLDPILSSSRYLIRAVAVTWWASGPSWQAASWLAGAFYAVTAALAYAIARLAMARWIAIAIAAAFLVSPLQIGNIGDLRDYSKAPILMATLFLCGVLVSRRLPIRWTVVCAAIAGATIGVGYGMRTDAMLNLAAVVVTLVAFLPGSLASTWRVRAAAVVVALTCFVASIGPLLVSRNGGYLWHWVVLGFADTFDQALDVREAPYQLGTFYNDEYVAAVIEAFDGRTGSRFGDTRFGGSGYAAAGRAYLLDMVAMFPGDMATRMCAAVLKVLELPFVMAKRQAGAVRIFPDGPPVLLRLIAIRDWVVGRAAGLGLAFATLAIILISTVDVRLALWLLFGVIFFGGATAIQFQPRHVFHLEIVGLLMIGVVVSLTVAVSHSARAGVLVRQAPIRIVMMRVATVTAVALAATVGATTLLRAVQHGRVERLLASYSQSQRSPVPIESSALDGGWTRLTQLPPGSGGSSAAVGTELLAVRLNRTCDSDAVELRLAYSSDDIPHDHSRSVVVAVPEAPEDSAEMFLPLLRPKDPKPFRVAGLDVRARQEPCIESVATVIGAEKMPVVVEALLPSSWRKLTLAQTIEPFEQAVTYQGRPRTITNAARVWPYSEVNQLVARVERSKPLAPEYVAPIAALGGEHALVVRGEVDNPLSYLAEFPPQAIEPDQLLVAEGSLATGGLTIGLADHEGWRAAAHVVAPGRFRVLVAPPERGPFRVVIANNVRTGFHNAATVDRVGLVHVSAIEGVRP